MDDDAQANNDNAGEADKPSYEALATEVEDLRRIAETTKGAQRALEKARAEGQSRSQLQDAVGALHTQMATIVDALTAGDAIDDGAKGRLQQTKVAVERTQAAANTASEVAQDISDNLDAMGVTDWDTDPRFDEARKVWDNGWADLNKTGNADGVNASRRMVARIAMSNSNMDPKALKEHVDELVQEQLKAAGVRVGDTKESTVAAKTGKFDWDTFRTANSTVRLAMRDDMHAAIAAGDIPKT